jgi:hypothetical protein
VFGGSFPPTRQDSCIGCVTGFLPRVPDDRFSRLLPIKVVGSSATSTKLRLKFFMLNMDISSAVCYSLRFSYKTTVQGHVIASTDTASQLWHVTHSFS